MGRAYGHAPAEVVETLAALIDQANAVGRHLSAMQKLELRTRVDVVRYAMIQGWLQDD